jgi:hypothetical protein
MHEALRAVELGDTALKERSSHGLIENDQISEQTDDAASVGIDIDFPET